jgi:hypothetical protein
VSTKRQRKVQRAIVNIALLVSPFVVCPLIMKIRPGEPPDFSDTRTVFQWRNGTWTAASQLAGGTDGLRISPSGKIWTSSPRSQAILQLENGNWVRHRAAGSFVLLGEEVWAATRDGVARFDGHDWKLYPESLKTRSPLAIAAGASGVWVVDRAGSLSHFDGETWGIENLKDSPAGKEWTERISEYDVQLAVTGDGALWLALDGVWRRDTKGWREVLPHIGSARFAMLGSDQDQLWFYDKQIHKVNPAGVIGAGIEHKDLPLPKDAWIRAVANSKSQTWIAAPKDVLLYDGNNWRHLGIPAGMSWVRELAAAPDGTVWAVGERRSRLKVALWVAPPLLASAFALIALGSLLVVWAKGNVDGDPESVQAVGQAAQAIDGMDMAALSAAATRQGRATWWWKVPAFLIGFPVAVGVVTSGPGWLAGMWQIPVWPLYATEIAVGVAVAAICIRRWFRNGSVPAKPGSDPLPPVIRFVFALAGIPWFLIHVGWMPGWLLIGMVLLGFVYLMQPRHILTALLSQKWIKAGDYDRALAIYRRFSFGRPSALMLGNQANVLKLAGRLTEAEHCVRRALLSGESIAAEDRIRALCALAGTLALQGRFEEAERCLQPLIPQAGKLTRPIAEMAEVLFLQGKEPGRIIGLIDSVLRRQKPSASAEELAMKAWALTALGHLPEAENAIREALGKADRTFCAGFASLHWRVGRARMAAQRLGEALEHFRIGAQADPHGQYGGLSRLELQQHGAQGD